MRIGPSMTEAEAEKLGRRYTGSRWTDNVDRLIDGPYYDAKNAEIRRRLELRRRYIITTAKAR